MTIADWREALIILCILAIGVATTGYILRPLTPGNHMESPSSPEPEAIHSATQTVGMPLSVGRE